MSLSLPEHKFALIVANGKSVRLMLNKHETVLSALVVVSVILVASSFAISVQNTVDFMAIDSKHFPKIYNFSQGTDFNINSMIIKQHLFIGIDLKNDTTYEKSNI